MGMKQDELKNFVQEGKYDYAGMSIWNTTKQLLKK